MDTDKAIDRSLEVLGLGITLKEQQRLAIKKFVDGIDVFVAMPTGYGKSYCYALLPVVFDILRAEDSSGYDAHSIAIVVSPLTALMMEQREKFTTQGITAEFVGELQQDLDALHGLREGKYQLVYISPESLLSNAQWKSTLLSTVYQRNLVALIIDEAHCITQW